MGVGFSVMIVGILSHLFLCLVMMDDFLDWRLFGRRGLDEELIIGSMILTGVCLLMNQGLLIHAVSTRIAGSSVEDPPPERGRRRAGGDRPEHW